jgi:hypothetical protein
MTNDDIIRMAREAGVDNSWDINWFDPYYARFAKLVAAAEREACAKVAEQIEREIFNAVGDPRVSEFKPKIAEAIRARGQG